MTELLAPAGSMDALRAAIANGANAVYLGGKTFSARAYADNFSLDEIAEAVRTAHFHKVKVYVAVNTLVADKEMVGLLLYVSELYERGVDAVIVQDVGALELIRQAIPGLTVYASTQMSIHNGAGCRLLAEEGVEQVILARELSFADMRAVKEESPIRLESFVHGALCVCYSGQCLFSSMVGGRSGNRGRCAQPCRMAYKLTDRFGDEIPNQAEGKYLLSPRDLFGCDAIKDLYDVGLDSWKIEGRMKKPAYVATVCQVYRQLLDKLDAEGTAALDDDDLRRLMQVFNRNRTTGYWNGNPGADLMSWKRPNNRGLFAGRITEKNPDGIKLKLALPLAVGDGVEIWQTGNRVGSTVESIKINGCPVEKAAAGDVVQLSVSAGRVGDRVFKTFDAALIKEAEESYQALPAKQLNFRITARIGEPIMLVAEDSDGYTATRAGDYTVQRSDKGKGAYQTAQSQLGRLGGTGYELGAISGEMNEDALLPASVLNQMRRDLVEDLMHQRYLEENSSRFDHAAFRKFAGKVEPKEPRPAASEMRCSVLVHTAEGVLAALRYQIRDIYFDVCGFQGTAKADLAKLSKQAKDRGARLIPWLSQIILPREEKAILQQVQSWEENDAIDAVLVNNIGHIRLLRDGGWSKAIYGGMGLNVFNSAACRFLARHGVSRVVLSPELTLEQLSRIDSASMEAEVFAQGALPLMVSEYCLLGAACGGRKTDENGTHTCSRPCREQNECYLSDEKGYRFPIRACKDCRMRVFNSREHCLLEDIPNLKSAGIGRILLDLRLYEQKQADRILALYRDGVGDAFSFAEAKQKLPTVVKEYTKGHLYRGV